MKLHKLAAIALAALLVTAGAAAAMPGNAPDHSGADEHEQASDNADGADDARDNETDDDHAGDAREMGAAASSQARSDHAQGPPTDMPAQVPDHVVEIHRLIADFLSGDLDGDLGSAVSGVTPDDGSENTADATA